MTVDFTPSGGSRRPASAETTIGPLRFAAPHLAILCSLAAVVLSGCGAAAPFSAAPALPRETVKQAEFQPAPPPPKPAARPAAGPGPVVPGVGQPDPRHRQYYDQRRHRFYYFDPVLKAYFWEDGAPR
jgi:hypothetical protein